MAAKHVSLTEAGLPKVNEDAFYADPGNELYILCDGVGGGGIGAAASALAIQSVTKFISERQSEFEFHRKNPGRDARRALKGLLEGAVLAACEAIFQAAQVDPAKKGMCTTLDVLVFTSSHMLAAHAGSGRIYLVRGGELYQISEDHTQLAHNRRTGKSDPPDAAGLNKRLTKAVGYQDTVKCDLLEVELQTDDRIFACSDGVWIPMNEGLLETVAASGDVNGAVKKLKEEVVRAGAKDNYTLAFISPEVPDNREGTNAGVKVQLTGRVPVFEYLTYPEVVRVLSVADLFKVNAGHIICKEGDPGGEMMLVVQGSVEVQKGGKRITQLTKGEFFGEMGMISVAPRSATIVAVESTNLLVFTRGSLFDLLRQEPGICVKFLWGLSQELNKRLRATSNQLVGKQAGNVAEKLDRAQLPFPK